MAAAPDSFRIALAQIDTTVGEIEGNADKVVEWARRAAGEGASLVVFPELTLSGYPPEDLLLKRHFLDEAAAALERLAGQLGDSPTAVLVGFPEREDDAVYNSLAVIAEGSVRSVYRKMLLPNYGVFDEKRYFQPGHHPAGFAHSGLQIGLTICEDIWEADSPALITAAGPGSELLINVSASPYHRGKGRERQRMLAERAREQSAYVALCSLVGGQDELVFDGQSMVLDPAGEPVARAKQFEEDLLIVDFDESSAASLRVEPELDSHDEVYRALCLGLRDYAHKNGFDHVVFGLSGGIDSALVACIAVDALGAECVSCAVMPSPHSSEATQGDARELARRLGVELFELPIVAGMDAYQETLAEAFAGTEPDVTEENVQARIRGNLVMALSNKFGWLPLSTGNKSEYSVGYTTLYGDMAGGFAVLKDVPKTLVYELARYRNRLAGSELIPVSVIERAPSAELRPDQQDQDSLPPYELLDRILEGYIEDDKGRSALIGEGFEAGEVDRVIAMVDHAEYKRRQAPPGVKITPKAFGRDRRLPITNRFRG